MVGVAKRLARRKYGMAEGARGYLESVQKLFPRFSIREKRFLRDFEDSLLTFEEEHPDGGKDALVEEFGTPQEVVQDFYEHSGLELYREMFHHHKSNQKGSALVAGIVAAMLVIPFVVLTPPCVYQVDKCVTSTSENIKPEVSNVNFWEVGQ
jgi:hypothetical protein